MLFSFIATAWHQDVFVKTIEEFVEENMFEST